MLIFYDMILSYSSHNAGIVTQ